jgi:cardiolipin synthase
MNRLKLLCALTAICLTLAAGSVFAADTQTLYKAYQSSYQSYVEAVSNDLPDAEVKARYEKYKAALENYKKVSGDTLTTEPAQAPAEAAIPAAAGSATANDGLRGGTNVTSTTATPAGKIKNDRLIAELEAKIFATRNAEQANLLKIELAGHYANLRGDYAKANELLKDVAGSTKMASTAKKANDAIKTYKNKADQQIYIKNIYAAKDKSKQAYEKYNALKWSSPFKKAAALGSYYASLFSYRRQIGEYKEFRKDTEDQKQRALVTDWSFDAATDSEVSPGNDATLLLNGKCAFAKRHEIAELAQSYIYLQYLSYKNDETGNKLADLLIRKARQGVDVRVIIDYWTTFSYKKDIVHKLRSGGVKVALYNSPYKTPLRVNNRNHQKLFIVDDLYAITGGMNIGDDYAKGSIVIEGWRDTDIMLEGPVIMQMKELFLNNWAVGDNQNFFVRDDLAELQRAQKEMEDYKIDNSSMYKPAENPKLIKEVLREYYPVAPKVSSVDIRFIAHYPTNKDDHALECFTWYIDRSSKEVILQTPYFLPSKRLEESLIKAAARGVKVSIITNSMYSNDMGKYIVYASHYFFQDLIEKNINIYEWYGSQTMHAKCNYFDGVAVTIGSYNLNSRSNKLDAEEMVLIENAEFAKLMHETFMQDLKYCKIVTLEEARKWRESFSEKMKMKVFHLVDFMF